MKLEERFPHLPSLLGDCPRCISRAGVDEPRSLTSPAWLLANLGLLAVAVIFPFAVVEGLRASSALEIPRLIPSLTAGILVVALEAALSTWHFPFKMNGKLHIHRQDPRKELLGNADYAWVKNEHEPSSAPYRIEGPIFRFRNGGYFFKVLYRLFRRRDPNRIFWPSHGTTADVVQPMRISDGSTIYNVVLISENPRVKDSRNVPLEKALEIASEWCRLGSYLDHVDQESGWFQGLRLSHAAVVKYLNSNRDRRGSPVGQHARELLEVALADLGVDFTASRGPLTEARVAEHLGRLEQLIAERTVKEAETVPAG
ncbi:MAG: hypothetical protein HYY50_00530 [Candidatus Kerfeldbacteria bacterium]|nr:hypothetical protein [Candidatus Kerfeldbacteria bacterium]